MIILVNIDWYGTAEKLKKFDEAWKKATEKVEGAKFMGRYAPWNSKYHWTYFTKVTDMGAWMKLNEVFEWDRDYKELTHQVVDIYQEPN